jgi:hypothetical protein
MCGVFVRWRVLVRACLVTSRSRSAFTCGLIVHVRSVCTISTNSKHGVLMQCMQSKFSCDRKHWGARTHAQALSHRIPHSRKSSMSLLFFCVLTNAFLLCFSALSMLRCTSAMHFCDCPRFSRRTHFTRFTRFTTLLRIFPWCAFSETFPRCFSHNTFAWIVGAFSAVVFRGRISAALSRDFSAIFPRFRPRKCVAGKHPGFFRGVFKHNFKCRVWADQLV